MRALAGVDATLPHDASNGGEFDGTRVLSRKSVELMTASQVDVIPLPFLPGQYFGLGVAVRKADGQAGLLGSPGTFGWNGAYNTYFRVVQRAPMHTAKHAPPLSS